MTDATYPQCRIVSTRLLNPETVERLMNRVMSVGGIRRIIFNGPRLPKTIPYGPAKGLSNPHTLKTNIKIGEQEVELQVHVGTILLEVEDRDVFTRIREACEEVFSSLSFSYIFQEGKFMKTAASLSDYAKYGPNANPDIIGLVETSNKSGPVILQSTK